MSDDTTEYSDETQQVVDELDTDDGPLVVSDKVVFSQAQIAAVLAGSATLAGVVGLASGRASAQTSGGKFGTSSEPLDADLGNYGYTSRADGADIEIEGETFEINQ